MKRALLVIDVQYEYFTGKMPVTYPPGSFDNILSAVDAANSKELPVILIRHENTKEDAVVFVKGSREWELHEELMSRKHLCIIDKHLPGSFTGTSLEEVLKEQEVDTVVIAGYMTQMCCDTTSRQAAHMGLTVEFLSDATGTLDFANYAGNVSAEELHKAVLTVQASAFAKVLPTQEWMKQI